MSGTYIESDGFNVKFADEFKEGVLQIWLVVEIANESNRGSHTFNLAIGPDDRTVKVCARDRERYRGLAPSVPKGFGDKFAALL